MINQLRALGLTAVLLSVLLTVAWPAIAAEASSPAAAEASLPVEPALNEPVLDAPALDAPTLDAPVLDAPPASTTPADVKPRPDGASEPASLPKPKTYFLQVMAGSPRRQITLNPPSTKLVVTFEAGEANLRCGVGSKGLAKGENQKSVPKKQRLQTYSCVLGKPLTIERDPEDAITRFWAQNLSEVSDVRLRLESYGDQPEGA